MKRRDFLAATALAGLAPLSEAAGAKRKERAKSRREYYELRHYRIQSKDKQKLVLDFLKAAAIPALNRIRITPVGVLFFEGCGDSGTESHTYHTCRCLQNAGRGQPGSVCAAAA
ncbi:MAG: hypothetical protein ACYS8I_06595 [Planctomycetota bacterium]|jgi:hypothetical protein